MDVRIGDIVLKDATVKCSADGSAIWLTFATDQTLNEITQMLDAGNAPVIEVIENGKVTAVYLNHALTRLQMETIGGKRMIEAMLSVTAKKPDEEEDDTDALHKEIDALRAQVETMSAALEAIEEGIANA